MVLRKAKPGELVVVGDQTPDFPEEFNRRLQAYDPDLVVAWHHPPTWPAARPGRWKIEQCIQHVNGQLRANGKPLHDHTCRRSYVWLVETPEKGFLQLGDAVLEKLREMRARSEQFGGETPRGLENWRRDSNNIDQTLEAKREHEREDLMEHNRRFNRPQLNKLYDLIQRHDVARPNR